MSNRDGIWHKISLLTSAYTNIANMFTAHSWDGWQVKQYGRLYKFTGGFLGSLDISKWNRCKSMSNRDGIWHKISLLTSAYTNIVNMFTAYSWDGRQVRQSGRLCKFTCCFLGSSDISKWNRCKRMSNRNGIWHKISLLTSAYTNIVNMFTAHSWDGWQVKQSGRLYKFTGCFLGSLDI